ncbi:hypothetical protein [Flavobacterium psychrotolerans]|uniref:Uncharacterized protein n=1 Tax=Flavobacterium psychrotolerans TaxID=2169410 RepID=A0A2U1JJB0_9FLAO|nr:hypothetical protein [Flavobacterium psychrotolerans]PWA05246.1 hypothetical protein DB895_08075 [Flavobacterium psychrotolerans]
MNLNKYRPILELFMISIVAYLAHKLFFYFKEGNPDFQNFHYPIETIYAFFFLCSAVILFILIQVNTKNIDNVGHSFLLITCVKMAISYAFLLPILHSGKPNIAIEKINFFVIFVLFLTIETLVTIRMLNNKQ